MSNIYFLRHGHRMDHGSLHEKESVANKWDPPLTQIGHYQAFMTGEALFSEIKDVLKKRILVISSPYHRCLETAERLIQGLNKRVAIYDNKIFVEDCLREWESNEFLDLDYQNLDYFTKDNFIGIETVYNQLDFLSDLRREKDRGGKSWDEMILRLDVILNQLKDFLSKSENEDIVPILVSHGYFVSSFYLKYHNKLILNYNYCALSSFKIEDNQITPLSIERYIYRCNCGPSEKEK